jgi:hypothetical protein
MATVSNGAGVDGDDERHEAPSVGGGDGHPVPERDGGELSVADGRDRATRHRIVGRQEPAVDATPKPRLARDGAVGLSRCGCQGRRRTW